MPNTFDRRTFLTHSAAAAGGIALAGTVVDAMVSAAGATTGVDSLPTSGQLGGTLTVGITSEVPSVTHFSGAQGKMDASGFCVANAVYETLFQASADGKTWLPNLATSATPDATYTNWTIKLRSGVTFHNGDAFNADTVVANVNAALADLTVGFAIKPLIKSCTKVDNLTVKYTVNMPWTTFPFQLSEQQIGFMAHPSDLDSAGGIPIGTGPFKLNSLSDWDHQTAGGGSSTWHKNTSYWKKDSTGRSLPYVNTLVFKVIVDDAARYQALQSGSIDLMITTDGATISQIKTSRFKWRTDENDPRDPSVTCLIVNTQQGTGSAPKGAVNPNTNAWDANAISVVSDQTIRLACAQAIDRNLIFSRFGHNVGTVTDGIYRKKSAFYKDPKYPALNPTAASKLVAAWKKKNGNKTPSFVIDIVQGSNQSDVFTLIKGMLAAVGITVTSRSLSQPDLIAKKISKQYDVSTWNQFGGVTPDLNYVWFNSGNKNPFGAGTVSNFVNFAQQQDPKLQAAMLTGMKSKPGTSAQIAAWATVNSELAKVLPYLQLYSTVTCWAAATNVKNFAYAAAPTGTGVNSTAQVLNPDGGSAKWEHIYVN